MSKSLNLGYFLTPCIKYVSKISVCMNISLHINLLIRDNAHYIILNTVQSARMFPRTVVLISFVLHVFNCNITRNTDGTVDVSLAQGVIRGEVRKSARNNAFVLVKSIPYAEPPVGSLRWMPPKPAESWTGLRDGRVDAPLCTQGSPDGTIVGDEDCLMLNVYFPVQETEIRFLPVMVWIHGGGFVGDC